MIFKAQAIHQNLNLVQRLPPKSVVIETDGSRVQQILINLLSNALKFSPKGSIITITLETIKDDIDQSFSDSSISVDSTTSQYLTWQLSVRDSGIGISERDQKLLFKPFFRTTDKVSREMNSQGHGLGLAISNKIAKFLGGVLKCESKVGEGTCFTLEVLGRECTDPAFISPDNKAAQQGSFRLKNNRDKMRLINSLADSSETNLHLDEVVKKPTPKTIQLQNPVKIDYSGMPRGKIVVADD
jgi:signal transduction histidine kinase